jgi:hypothetical protein
MKRRLIVVFNILLVVAFMLYFFFFFLLEQKKKKASPQVKVLKIGKFVIELENNKYESYFINACKWWSAVLGDNKTFIKIKTTINTANPNYVIKTKLLDYYYINNDQKKKPFSSELIINTIMFEDLTETMKLSLIKHEICHSLGFGGNWEIRYSYEKGNYLDKDIYPLTYDAYKTITGIDPIVGLPLENSGGKGLENIHWENEDRYFGNVYIRGLKNELMTSVIQEENALSLITLNNLKDMGWEINSSFVAETIDFDTVIRLGNLKV